MRLGPLLIVALVARLAAAQAPDTTHRASGATVDGVVRDSIAHVPLAGAIVQLVAADNLARFVRATVSDSQGRFTLSDVPDGRYTLGFLHPLLDSLGVEPPLRDVSVARQEPVRADLASPSPARLRAAICSPRSAPDSGAAVSGAVVLGIVIQARERTPAAGVTVTGEWLEFTFRRKGVDRRRPRLVVTTGENGWFALCNVPIGGTMLLGASRGADSTDLIEVQVPAHGVLRTALFLGPALSVVAGDTTPRTETLAPPSRRLRLGDGRLRGTVVSAEGRQPLAGALVRIADGPQARANEHGEWTLADAPVGTRMLEVHAIGYYPARHRVDVVAGAAPVTVALSTFKSVLDTVKVMAERLADRSRGGFDSRRRSGVGRYLTHDYIARRAAIVTSDLFRMVPGVRLDGNSVLERRILMRGISTGWCAPAIYLDGLYMFDLTADEVDSFVSPQHIAGVEIYTEVSVPPDYQRPLSGCGAILIWTK